ncbi:hypothetical protein JB92DRAFT_2892129 [Gautieria morchelliformis]|nr:hypothetical protein JB92DRAFT_2892129 [Gautieria morchelliformis]
MGGFTRPRDLRAANWFPGGPYLQRQKTYESPHESAYEAHTVFLLETRHRVRHGIGRVDSKDHVVGVCRAADFVKIVHKYNSKRCPADARESLDNACWPWLPKSGKVLKPTRWWGPDENPELIMREIYEDDNYTSRDLQKVLQDAEDDVEEESEEPLSNHSKKPKIIRPEPARKGSEGEHAVTAAVHALEDEAHQKPPHMANNTFNIDHIRETYQPLLATEPFWLPLVAITYSTRPLALTIARLSRGRERGLPFYASMSNDDRKCLFSFGNRMTSMRLDRMRQLTLDVVSRLAGHMGGFVGIRFSTRDKGRGIGGEGLADPIPPDKRIIKVQLGNWFYRSEDEAALYRGGAEEWGATDALEVAMMNEWGRRLDADGNEVPLTEEEMSTDEIQETEDDDVDDEDQQDREEEDSTDEALLRDPTLPGKKWRVKPELAGTDEVAEALRRKLAYRLVGGHRSVMRV